MTDAEKKIMQEFYRQMEEEAVKQKKCITCIHRVPGLPFDPFPPRCNLGGEAVSTCERYTIIKELKEVKHE